VARTRRYKKVEKNIFLSIINQVSRFFKFIKNKLISFYKLGTRKLTIMIVPHSQSKVLNFQTNMFAVSLGLMFVAGIALSNFYFNKKHDTSQTNLSRLTEENRKTSASLDELRDETNNLLQVAKRFKTSFTQTLAPLGITKKVSQSNSSNNDLNSLFGMRELSSGTLSETTDIKELTSFLENAIQPIEQVSKMLQSQGTLFADIPSVWPLKGGIGHVSAPFGQSQHPITGQWYIHKGMDFSTWRTGDQIIATANGKVVTVTYDNGFGNYIVIQHKHGFYTRYAHMDRVLVKPGQTVSQGEVIGRVGNTGISTGPHLHYEIHIGSDVVDPAKYINVKMTK
jgi:murein DD-endopeptidase MepM/ murein hydrolase activator NlpD